MRAGQRAVLATVVHTWGSAPRPPGALVAIRGDGQIVGSVSGGCIEDDLVERIRTGILAVALPERVRYGVSADEANRFGLPCGGTIELVVEALSPGSQVEELLARVERAEQTTRRLDLRTGLVTLESGADARAPAIDESSLTTTHGPAWRLLIIGAGQMAQSLAEMALALDYEVIACDPREEYASEWSVTGARLVRSMPDDTVLAIAPDPHTAIVALTHDPKLDDLALIEALRSRAFYVGAIGSRRTQEKRKERLLEFGVSNEQFDALHGPVGLKNGARTPAEIAVSILAELTAAKYGYAISKPVPVSASVA